MKHIDELINLYFLFHPSQWYCLCEEGVSETLHVDEATARTIIIELERRAWTIYRDALEAWNLTDAGMRAHCQALTDYLNQSYGFPFVDRELSLQILTNIFQGRPLRSHLFLTAETTGPGSIFQRSLDDLIAYGFVTKLVVYEATALGERWIQDEDPELVLAKHGLKYRFDTADIATTTISIRE